MNKLQNLMNKERDALAAYNAELLACGATHDDILVEQSVDDAWDVLESAREELHDYKNEQRIEGVD
jgi:hypothetical protein